MGKRYSSTVGGYRVQLEDRSAEDILKWLETASDGMTQLLAAQANKQLADARRAFPKPPDQYRTRTVNTLLEGKAKRRTVKLKRTGRLAAGWKLDTRKEDGQVRFIITNTATDSKGEVYVWYLRTDDLRMDGKKGKKTRAWHHFRRRVERAIQKTVVEQQDRVIPKEV